MKVFFTWGLLIPMAQNLLRKNLSRLGVHTKYQRRGNATSLFSMTKEYFLKENRIGCRFLTVDTYNKEFFDLKRFNRKV